MIGREPSETLMQPEELSGFCLPCVRLPISHRFMAVMPTALAGTEDGQFLSFDHGPVLGSLARLLRGTFLSSVVLRRLP